MHHTIFHSLREFVATYGYWAVALALLCENAGIPVPGETTLLLASFLAYAEHRLHLGWIIVVATFAATLGDNLGYAIGHYGGRPLLDRYQSIFRISPAALKRGEDMFARYGAAAIFNFLGAAVWVTSIASAGYLFGRHWRSLLRAMQRFNIAVLIVAWAVILFLWWRYRRRPLSEND